MRSAYIYNFLIEANIMAGIAILLMIPLRKFFRKQLGNSALCLGWLLIAIRLLCPLSIVNPLIHEIRSPFAADTAIRPIAGQIKVRVTDAVEGLSDILWRADNMPAYEAVDRVRNGMDNASVSILLARIWILGVLLTAAWFVFSNIRFRMRLRAGRIEPISGELLDQYNELCRVRGIRPVPVYFTDPLPSACLVGVFRPYIALPLTASPQDAILVLTHEICHLKNLDPLWGVVRLLCCAVHWFNPLVWLAASMSRTDGELRCDDRVTSTMDLEGRKSYASVLVLSASRRNAPGLGVLATGMTMTGKRLKTRIATVMHGAKPLRALAVSFSVLACMCLLGAFATSETQEQLETGVSFYGTEKYLSSAVAGTQQIRTESEAIEYARSLWDRIRVRDADGEWTAHHMNDGSWFVLMIENETEPFSVNFLSNGVITDIAQNLNDDGWFTDGKYVESTVMDPNELAEVTAWAADMLESLIPGLGNEVQTFRLEWVRDTGSSRTALLSADPKDSSYDAGVSLFVRIGPDRSCILQMMQLSGNG